MKRMNDDPNTNVRLAALDALIQFHEDILVRHQPQSNPCPRKGSTVQISLIPVLVRLKKSGESTAAHRG